MIAAALIGAVCGCLTGLVPGLHVNAVAAMAGAGLLGFGPDGPAAIVALTVAHGIAEIVPVLLVGAPTDDAYALQPAHRLVAALGPDQVMRLCLQTVWLTLATTTLVCLAILHLPWPMLPWLEGVIRPVLGVVLAVIPFWLVRRETSPLAATSVYVASGLLGLLVLDTALVPNTPQAVFSGILPALSGLFGLSGALAVIAAPSSSGPSPTPPGRLPADWRDIGMGSLGGLVAGFLPGLGAANLATMTSVIRPLDGDQRYIAVTTAINSANAVFALAMWSLADRIRSGPAAVMASLAGSGRPDGLPTLLVAAFVGAGVGTLMLQVIGRPLAKRLQSLDAAATALGLTAAIICLVAVTTGFSGCVILLAGLVIGIAAIRWRVARAHAMGFFLLPVTLYYLGWKDAVTHLLGIQRVALAGPTWTLATLGLLCLAMMMSAWLGYHLLGLPWVAAGRQWLKAYLWPESGPVVQHRPQLEDGDDDDHWGDWTSWS